MNKKISHVKSYNRISKKGGLTHVTNYSANRLSKPKENKFGGRWKKFLSGLNTVATSNKVDTRTSMTTVMKQMHNEATIDTKGTSPYNTVAKMTNKISEVFKTVMGKDAILLNAVGTWTNTDDTVELSHTDRMVVEPSVLINTPTTMTDAVAKVNGVVAVGAKLLSEFKQQGVMQMFDEDVYNDLKAQGAVTEDGKLKGTEYSINKDTLNGVDLSTLGLSDEQVHDLHDDLITVLHSTNENDGYNYGGSTYLFNSKVFTFTSPMKEYAPLPDYDYKSSNLRKAIMKTIAGYTKDVRQLRAGKIRDEYTMFQFG